MTLQDALDAKFVEILSVQRSLEVISIEELPGLGDSYQNPISTRKKNKFVTQLSDAQLKQSALKNVKGEFSIIVYRNEKCVFREYCESAHCLFKSTRWTVHSMPFSCGIPHKLGDYKKIIFP